MLKITLKKLVKYLLKPINIVIKARIMSNQYKKIRKYKIKMVEILA